MPFSSPIAIKIDIIWLDGDDIKGSDSREVWKTISQTINQIDSAHLITFHPRGRASSSEWFHNEPYPLTGWPFERGQYYVQSWTVLRITLWK